MKSASFVCEGLLCLYDKYNNYAVFFSQCLFRGGEREGIPLICILTIHIRIPATTSRRFSHKETLYRITSMSKTGNKFFISKLTYF